MLTRSPDTSRGTRLTALLLQAMGLAGSAALAAACGGTVVFDADGDAGSGGAGGGSTGDGGARSTSATASANGTTGVGTAQGSTAASVSAGPTTVGVVSSATSSGSGTFTCDATPRPGQELQLACFSPTNEGCPDRSSDAANAGITAALSDLGCGGFSVDSVPCGPDTSVEGQCCYYAIGVVLECGGRPFVVHGAATTAAAVERADWSAAIVPDLAGLDAGARSVLARAWAKNALDEHASVASFARFALELLAVGAPAELVDLAQRAMGDEVRHAQLCFGLATAYAGAPVGPSALSTHGPLVVRSSLAEVAAAAVREGCVGETVAAFLAGAAREGATDAAVRNALAVITRDESSHAALAWKFVAWAVGVGGREVASAVEEAFAAALATRPSPVTDGDGDARIAAHGQLSSSARHRLATEALEQVVRPCAEALRGSYSGGGDAPRGPHHLPQPSP